VISDCIWKAIIIIIIIVWAGGQINCTQKWGDMARQ